MEQSVPPGMEWTLLGREWKMLCAVAGMGYLRADSASQEMGAGAMAIIPPNARVEVTSSRLAGLKVVGTAIDAELLDDVLTLSERRRVEVLGQGVFWPFTVLKAEDAMARRFSSVTGAPAGNAPLERISVLQMFLECLGDRLREETVAHDASRDARDRLVRLLGALTESEFQNLSITDLAQRMNCTPRHAARVCRDVLGDSLRSKITLARLRKATKLLGETDLKVIDVALESGYRSLSLFNALFKRTYGTTPAAWRERNGVRAGNGAVRRMPKAA